MFGGDSKIRDLQQQLDELRNYCIKLTQDVNNFAAAVQQRIDELEGRLK